MALLTMKSFLGKVVLWKRRCLCKGRVIETKAAMLFWLLFSMFGIVGFFKTLVCGLFLGLISLFLEYL